MLMLSSLFFCSVTQEMRHVLAEWQNKQAEETRTKLKRANRKQSAVKYLTYVTMVKVSRPLLKTKPFTVQINVCLYLYF